MNSLEKIKLIKLQDNITTWWDCKIMGNRIRTF